MKIMLPGLLLALLLPGPGLRPARAQTVTVAPDGSGQFRTIQAAINSLPDAATKPRTVFLKNGTYREKIYLDGKARLVLKGESEKGVILTYPQARDMWLCGPGATAGDWGVATLNLRNCPDITLENLTVINSYGFEAVGEVSIDCPGAPAGRKTVSKTGHQMALRALPGATRLIVRHCTFRALGGDTVSPWDTEAGAYYFQNCTLEGGVDFTARAAGPTPKTAASSATAGRPPSGTTARVAATRKPCYATAPSAATMGSGWAGFIGKRSFTWWAAGLRLTWPMSTSTTPPRGRGQSSGAAACTTPAATARAATLPG